VPTNKVQFRERSVRRIIRAAQKEGLVPKSATIAPDGSITFTLAEPSRREVPLDLSRDIDDIVPITPQLQEIIAASPVNQLAFVVSELGKPYTATGFSNRFRKDCDKAGLPHCTAHGLRKAAARRLAEAGCTEHEIKSVTGHASLKEVVRYTKGVNQRRLAMVAMEKVRKTTA
jgi:integrase